MFSLSPVAPEKVPGTQVSQVSHVYSPFTTGGGPRVVVSTAALHARARGSVPGLGGLKETKMFLSHPRVKGSIVGSLRDREIACSFQTARARISNPVSGGQCHLIYLTILRRFFWPSLHKGGLKPDSFHFPVHNLQIARVLFFVSGGSFT